MTFYSQRQWHISQISLKFCWNWLAVYGGLFKHANKFGGKWVSWIDSLWSLIKFHLKVNLVRFRKLSLQCASAIRNKYK